MKRNPTLTALFLIAFSQLLLGARCVNSRPSSAELPPQQASDGGMEEQIRSVVMEEMVARRPQVETEAVVDIQIDNIRLSKDGQWATAWILYHDETLGIFLPTEPGMALVRWDGMAWQVALPRDTDWDQVLRELPTDLLSADEKEMWSSMNQGESVEAYPDAGYKLPWRGGVTGYMSRSVSHDDDYTTAHYSFDFFFLGTTVCPTVLGPGLTGTTGADGLNFDIYASKAGTVWTFEDSVIDCNHEEVNFLVLRNNDNPANFQLYLHLSQDSIPDALKVIGAPVAQGQFIGRADNTGASTGSHLHFQLQGQPYWPTGNPYWAVAKDMIFSDVNIYGGHPRREWEEDPEYCQGSDGDDICDEYGRLPYVSGNYPSGDSTPPTGGLSGITLGQVVDRQMLTVSGWGDDSGSGLASMQLTAFYNSAWHDIGSPITADFTYTWDLCDPNAAVPDGLVSVALNVYDRAGNVLWLAGLNHFTKDYTCPIPPPACLPGPDQVTLFEGLDYTEGCVRFGIGNYANGDALSPLGSDDVASILVGSNVSATLYSEVNYGGHSQTLIYSDSNLSDNLVPADRLSALRVASRASLPVAPVPVSPAAGTQFKQGDLITLGWRDNGGAVEYQVQLTTPTTILSLPWQSQPYLPQSGLTQGAYSWKVRGRNMAGEGPWSATLSFGIGLPEARPATQTAPYTDNMETSGALWSDTGIWSLKIGGGVAGSYAWWYQETDGDYATGASNYGWLTSPPITIPANGYYLRFYYRYQSETYGTAWDQRWVQISVAGGPFQNFYQLSEDAQTHETSSWLKSPPLSLDGYRGSTIQVRFTFYTLDEALNGFQGWGIDDFSITTSIPAVCTDLRDDEAPAQATILEYNTTMTVQGEICPNGDWDYYQFAGTSGDRIVVDINAISEGSLLDPYVLLYDSDGATLLAENDDEIYAVRRDSLLAYSLPHDGVYYIKIRAWMHPAVGGQDYYYTIRLYEDGIEPTITFSWPQTGGVLPDAVFNVLASITDVNDGMHRVDFYWHNQEWQNGIWELIGTDWDGSDGWGVSFDPAGEPEGQGAAFYATAYDRAGNTTSVAVWELIIDKAAPTSAMLPLSATQASTAFQINWWGTDNLSGIWYYELQQSLNAGAWANWGQIDGQLMSVWIVGTPGNSYQYRLHAIDLAGNSEDYPSAAEASTSVLAANTLCSSLDSYDTGGNDNSSGTANDIVVNGAAQSRNFCNPLENDFLFDEDWISFPVQAGLTYFIEAIPLAPQTAVLLNLVAQDGASLLAVTAPDRFGARSLLRWTSDRDGIVYIDMQHLDGRVIGSTVTYQVQVRTGYGIYIPMLTK
jgi:hypothetical protein